MSHGPVEKDRVVVLAHGGDHCYEPVLVRIWELKVREDECLEKWGVIGWD